jgi:hypothetical protein
MFYHLLDDVWLLFQDKKDRNNKDKKDKIEKKTKTKLCVTSDVQDKVTVSVFYLIMVDKT